MNDWGFLCKQHLLAKPSVSYFCPANLQSPIGTPVLTNQISVIFYRYFFPTCSHFSCLDCSLVLWELLQHPSRRKRILVLQECLSCCCTTDRPGSVRLRKHLMANFGFFVQSVVVSVVESYTAINTLTRGLVYIT